MRPIDKRIKDGVGAGHKSIGLLVGKGGKTRVDLGRGTCAQRQQLPSECIGCRLKLTGIEVGRRIVRAHQCRKQSSEAVDNGYPYPPRVQYGYLPPVVVAPPAPILAAPLYYGRPYYGPFYGPPMRVARGYPPYGYHWRHYRRW